jgi:hypothetical protein
MSALKNLCGELVEEGLKGTGARSLRGGGGELGQL